MGETVVVAVSGGADSVSLLLALHELKKSLKLELRIVAAHLNHQLRGPESEADEDFVRHLTTDLRIELALHRAHVPVPHSHVVERPRYGQTVPQSQMVL